ncbi:MAG: hypothetical protein FJ317_06320, partial [SAR202 cluster bacterium]|nr:hypothetical protein [SAR202 cluster bacterium]
MLLQTPGVGCETQGRPQLYSLTSGREARLLTAIPPADTFRHTGKRRTILAIKGRAAVLVDDFKFEIRELPAPPVEEDGILVKVTACGLCGSDLHVWRGEIKAHNYILGHELTGRVHSLGKKVKTDSHNVPLKEGDRVIFSYFTPCHRCYQCT